ncbi:MAG: DUF4126 domain-containing protein [Planctomycetota bacterium]
MNAFEILLAVGVGVGLAAACGFRVFVPFFLVGVAHRAGYVPPGLDSLVGMDWLSTDLALVVLGVATVAEVLAFYVPWFDNLMDTIATPLSGVAGTVMMMGVLDGAPEPIQWGLGVLVGGGTSLGVQATTALTRGASTVATAGLGNPIVATVENVGSSTLAVLAVLIGPIVIVAVVALVFWFVRKLARWRRRGRDESFVAASLAETPMDSPEAAMDEPLPAIADGELAISEITPPEAMKASRFRTVSRRRMSPMLRGKRVVGLRGKPGG